jgi:UDP-glucose 4-epimerase
MAKGGFGALFILRYVNTELSCCTFSFALQAYKAVGESSEIPLTYYKNNVSATVSLLQIMGEFECTRFVYSSSATVYGKPPLIPIPETTRLEALSPYGRTKVMAETILSDLCHCKKCSPYSKMSGLIIVIPADKEWRAISLRYFKCVPSHIGNLVTQLTTFQSRWSPSQRPYWRRSPWSSRKPFALACPHGHRPCDRPCPQGLWQ